jgi:single-strand DNA-binding protein
MAFTTLLTAVGNLTADPELRYSKDQKPVVSFTVASTPRALNRTTREWEDGEPVFLRCSAWDEMAENIAASLKKGNRVMVQGSLKARTWQTKEGENRRSDELQVDEIGVTLKYHTAVPEKRGRTAPAAANGKSSSQDNDGWVTVDDDDTPF